MKNKSNQISCPNCGHVFQVEEVFLKEAEDSFDTLLETTWIKKEERI